VSEEHPTQNTQKGFFSRMFVPREEEGDRTAIYSSEEIGASVEEGGEGEERRRGFTVERAAEIIEDLPQDVPRASALRIVKGTLAATGIEIEELTRSARAREARLGSEIELSRGRIRELREKTDEVIRSLQDEIRKAREARDTGIAEEEEKISTARAGLDDIDKVREFFDLPGERPEPPEEASGDRDSDDTHVMRREDMDDTRVMRRPGPLSEDWNSGDDRDADRETGEER
jgi:hypothetical protein